MRDDPFTVALRLTAALDAAGIPNAIGGALAFGIWGDPRGTVDVDLNVFVAHDQLDRMLDVLGAAGVRIDRSAAHAADIAGDVIIGDLDGMRIDLFTPSIPFAWEAARTAVSRCAPAIARRAR